MGRQASLGRLADRWWPGALDARRARVLDTLASLLDAGLRPDAALSEAGLARLAGRDGAARAVERLRAGAPLAESLEQIDALRGLRPRIEAAETAGRLPDTLRRISQESERAAQLARRV